MSTQLALVQIDSYEPWTVTPDPRREMDLQTLQLRLSADLVQYADFHDGYVFFTRFSSMVAVISGLDHNDHELLQESIVNRYPVTPNLGIGVDRLPVVTLERATDRIQRIGGAQDGNHREALSGETLADADRTETDLQIAHFDVNDTTGGCTDRLSEFNTLIHIEQDYALLMRHLREEHGALSFFVGGDNITSVTPDLTEDQYRDAIDHVEAKAGVELKVDVDTASDARRVNFAAKHALEDRRHRDTAVKHVDTAVEIADD